MIRTWWAVAALLALFAMHGLATHAAAAEPPSPSGMHGTHHVLDAHGEAAGSELPPTEHGGDHHAMSVLGLCMAALATTAIALLALARPGRGLLALLPRATTVASRAVGVVRAPAPPDLHALSVLRC